jgi:hypothetical protein
LIVVDAVAVLLAAALSVPEYETVAVTLAVPAAADVALMVTVVEAPAASAVSAQVTVLAVLVQVPPDVVTVPAVAPVRAALKSIGAESPDTLRTVAVY